MPTNKSGQLNNFNLDDYLISVTLDVEANSFNETAKRKFLNDFEDYLRETPDIKLKLAKVYLINQRTSIRQSGSTVVLEIIVVDQIFESQMNDYNRISISHSKWHDNTFQISNDNEILVKSDDLVSKLRRKQSSLTIFDSLANFITSIYPAREILALQKQDQSYSQFNIISISKVICTNSHSYNNNNSSPCSNHGKCDSYSHKCICNKYWMPNLYKYYLQSESDLTDGNNCGKILTL